MINWGVDGRDHDVVVAVHDKGRLFDGLEFRKTFATRLTPLGDSRPLCCHCLRRCGRVHVILSHVPSRPEGPCGGLARSGRAEEQIKKRLDRDFAGLRIGQGGVLAVFQILWRITRARAGASEYETADQLGTAEREGLRDVSADGEAQQIDLRKSERADEIGGVVGHRINRVRRLSGRRGDPRIVEQDDGPMFRKAVGDRGIPVIHSTPKMLHENERHAARLAESAIGEADPVSLDELCRRGFVGVYHCGRASYYSVGTASGTTARAALAQSTSFCTVGAPLRPIAPTTSPFTLMGSPPPHAATRASVGMPAKSDGSPRIKSKKSCVETPNRAVYALFCAISIVGTEAPSIRLKALRLPPSSRIATFSLTPSSLAFATAASTIFCASSKDMLYFFTRLAMGLTPHLICTAYALRVDRV